MKIGRVTHVGKAVLVALGFAASAPALDIYVDQNAGGANNGTSWTDAYLTLTNALALKTGEVFVAKGTYTMANTDIKTNNLYGGYPTGGGTRNLSDNPTILDGGGANRVLQKTVAGVSTLDGFTVRNGNTTSDGAGLNVAAGSMNIFNCVFTNNVAMTNGGAIKILASVNSFSNCTFIANTASTNGGAIYSGSSTTNTFVDCAFTTNTAFGTAFIAGGGAINLAAGLLSLTRCAFTSNSSGRAGGAIKTSGTLDLSGGGNVFAGNSSANDGGAIANSGTRWNVFSNCTFTANTAASSDGGAVFISGASTSTFRNCAFITNTAPMASVGDGGAIYGAAGLLLELSNCTFSNNTCAANGGTILFNGNITATNTDFGGGSGLNGGAINKGGGGFTSFGNCGFVANQASGILGGGALLFTAAMTGQFVNCTFFTNRASNASGPGGAIHSQNASTLLTVTNCIFWGNTAGGAGRSITNAGTLNIGYCDVTMSGVSAGTLNQGGGMIDVDPLFASESAPYDVHLKSLYGRWNPVAGRWTNDTVQSQCIDAGDPGSAFALEPYRPGAAINLGRYGNTAQASWSAPALTNTAVIATNGSSATVTATLFTDASSHWVSTQWKLTTDTGWTGSSNLPAPFSGLTNLLTNTISGLAAGNYYVTFRATNATADIWATNWLSLTIAAAGGTPEITNQPATLVTTTSATLNATLTTNGANTEVWAYWGTNNGAPWGSTNYFGTNVTFTVPIPFATNVTGLTPKTTYYYAFYASNSAGPSVLGTPVAFRTHGIPDVENLAPGTGVGTADMKGRLTATNGADSSVGICWGTSPGSTSTGSWSAVVDFGPKSTNDVVTNSVSGLIYGERYYYRTFGVNTYGTNWAASDTNFFTVKPTGVGVTNTPATVLSATSAVLNGTLYATGSVYGVWANWWVSPGGATNSQFLGSWTNVVQTNLSYTATGLSTGTTYGFAFRATNLAESVTGTPARTFKTLGPPGVSNDGGASNVTATSATLNGILTNGGTATVTIYWGPTQGGEDKNAWSNYTPSQAVGETLFSSVVSILPEQTNYYRCYATNDYGDAWAPDTRAFTSGPPVYVDGSVLSEGDGTSWGTAFKTLTNALATAPNGSVFWVADGVYTSTVAAGIDIKAGTLYGGFQGTETALSQRDWTNYPTILDGGGANRVLQKTVAGRAVLDGFVVRNGSVTNDGAGLQVSVAGGSLTILNCVFSNNAAITGGGAVLVGASTVNTFSNCTFSANSSSNSGGAVYSSVASITNTFTDCTFTTNRCWGSSASSQGGAMRIAGGLLQVIRCVFSNNWTGGSGGALSGGAAFDLSGGGNIFAGNSSANDGGAIANSGTDPNAFSNCTFTANTAGTDGGAVYLSGASVTTFRNCAFIANTAPMATFGDGGAIYSTTAALEIDLLGCAFSNNTCAANGGTINFTGNIAATNTDFVGGSGLIGGAIYKGGGGFTSFGNCGFVANQASGTLGGGAVYVHSTSPTTNGFLNCTFFTNRASNASGPGGAVRVNHASSVLNVTNSIFWQNAAGGAGTSIQSPGTLNIAYCDIAMSGVSVATTNLGSGMINMDPLFASASVPYDVHVKSEGGRWDPGAAQWVKDAVHSPCIDAGDPAGNYALEPADNGARVNLGRYGNTAEASKTRPWVGTLFRFR